MRKISFNFLYNLSLSVETHPVSGHTNVIKPTWKISDNLLFFLNENHCVSLTDTENEVPYPLFPYNMC